jgi:hypothetical protein
LIARFERFKVVLLDFEDVNEIGQAFADELFRVYGNDHPAVELVPINMTEPVAGNYVPVNAFQYMERLRKLLEVSEGQMALARLYLERLVYWTEEPIAFSAVHRLLGTAVVLAHKFDSDFPYSDRTYAAAVGVVPKELKRMQLLFLQKIDYRLMYPIG